MKQPWPDESWLAEIERQLVANRLPAAYIQRFLDELADHFQDVMEDVMNVNEKANSADVVSRLGDPSELADAATIAYRRRTFFGRHSSAKFWVFVVSPILSLSSLFALALGCLIGLCSVYEWLGFNLHIERFEPIASTVLLYALSLMMVIIPTTLANVFYCKLARKFNISYRWALASLVLLAVLAFLPIWTVKLSGVPHKSFFGFGLRLPQTVNDIVSQTVWYFSSFRQMAQLLAPLAIGLWLLRRTQRHADDQNESMRIAA